MLVISGRTVAFVCLFRWYNADFMTSVFSEHPERFNALEHAPMLEYEIRMRYRGIDTETQAVVHIAGPPLQCAT